MASNPEDPLASFARLGSSVYLQDSDSSDKAKPVIFIAFWMNAPARALAKYVLEYRRIVPSARIIFVRSSSNDFLWPSKSKTRRDRLAPAVTAMQGLVTPENPVFLHLFSNGGLSHTGHLLQAWKTITGTPLPISALILDSAPGSLSLRSGLRAFSFALPQMWILRILGKGFLFVFLLFTMLIHAPKSFPDPITLARKLVNDTSLVQPAGRDGKLARCYLYSDTDPLVDWRDTESHASEAEAKGWAVRRELFKGSPHVGHMRSEPDRYWGVIKGYLGALVST
ncbi:unnamed protein product [Penicillium salamii]|uniref:Indole-diterpene biosynthesis protein PaxU n=1 Tax=Penicillium salamii TaxID=1612424 RepID=A0A9W4J2A8_9EURO|nr:unnamed protein product [Penicillium salamii]CAG8084682.1 unnamed protein product [Penicillium salamii]CAG8240896.1 unnamed protein product [Penicillium salamii]CAG8244124.1 unnamed protein product [Penicillium salamii]CAG8265533.1 unnamed protein product [Penicillium salamii]